MAKRWLVTGLVLLTGASLTGCSSEPKVSELGSQLQQDGREVLAEASHFSGVKGAEPTVTEDGSKDIACGDDKVKRVFNGSYRIDPGADLDNTMDLTFKLIVGQLADRPYELTTTPDSDDLARRTFALTGTDKRKITLNFTMTNGKTPKLELAGETACVAS